MFVKSIKILFILLSLSLTFTNYQALATGQWKTAQDGAWNDPNTWVGGVVPELPSTTAIILDHAITIGTSEDLTGASLTINGSLTVEANANLIVGDADFAWTGVLLIEENGILTLDNIDFNNGGATDTYIHGTLNVIQDATNPFHELISLFLSSTGSMSVGGDFLSKAPFYVDGNLEVGGSFTSSSGDFFNVTTNGNVLVHTDFFNTSGGGTTIDAGTITVEGDFSNEGDVKLNILNGGSLNIEGSMVNGGGGDFNIVSGNINITGNFTNEGGSTASVGENTTMTIGGDYDNSTYMIIEGEMSVEGTLTNSDIVAGSGSLSVDSLVDPNDGVSLGLFVTTRLYAIANGDWNDPAIWSNRSDGVPCGCIPDFKRNVKTNGFNVSINTNIEVNQVYISENSQLYLYPTSSIIANSTVSIYGEFKLASSATASPSFINKADIIYGPNAIYHSRIFIRPGEFNYISSPFANSPSDSIKYARGALNPNVYQYDETAADHWGTPNDDNGSNDYLGWTSIETTLIPGRGYTVYTPYISYYSLTGNSFLTGNQSVSISETINTLPDNNLYDGWNLIGNPYPSAIDVDSVNKYNLTSTTGNIYLWDDDNSSGENYASGDYIQINLAGSISGGNGSTFSGFLKANQAFFVKASVTNGSVVFNDNMRSIQTNTLSKSSKKEQTIEKFKFYVEDTDKTLYNESLIAFTENASKGVDVGYDGIKRKGNENIALYSILNEKHYGIQALAPIINETQISLGLDLSKEGSFTFNVKESTLNENTKVYLKDNFTGIELEINPTQNYNFEGEEGSSDRFVLIFKYGIFTEIENLANENNYNVYTNETTLFVKTNNEEVTILVSDLLGRTLSQHYLTNSSETIELPEANQIYIIRIKNKQNQVSTYKVRSK